MKPLFLSLVIVLSAPAVALSEAPSGNSQEFKGRLTRLHMVDEKMGWASGADSGELYLLRTEDGGRHWRDVTPVKTMGEYHPGDGMFDVEFGFLDASTGCVAMPGKDQVYHVYATRDGGQHWTKSKFDDHDWVGMDICFVDSKHAFIEAHGDDAMGGKEKKAIYSSVNGGLTWEEVSVDSSSSPKKDAPLLPYIGGGDISFRSTTEGWFAGSSHESKTMILYHTADAGRTWRPQPLAWPAGEIKEYAQASAPQFFGRDNKEGLLAVGFDELAGYLFATYATYDGGKTWLLRGTYPFHWNREQVMNGQQVSTSFSDQDHGVLICGKRILSTSNGGKTWHETNAVAAPVDAYSIQLQFITSDSGRVLINDSENKTSSLLQTHDGGATWARIF